MEVSLVDSELIFIVDQLFCHFMVLLQEEVSLQNNPLKLSLEGVLLRDELLYTYVQS